MATMLPYGSTAIKHPVPNRVKPSFVICNIWALLTLSHMATVGVEGLNYYQWLSAQFHIEPTACSLSKRGLGKMYTPVATNYKQIKARTTVQQMNTTQQ